MSIQMLFFTAFSLSMDTFAVSIIRGFCHRNISSTKNSLSSGVCFGFFQGLMLLLGFLAGSLFSNFVKEIDHWIALILLSMIGIKMIYDGFEEHKNPEVFDTNYSSKTLVLQGIATSINAFSVGIGFAVIHINRLVACAIIAITTFIMSFFGVHIGRFFSDNAQFIGCTIFYKHIFVVI